MGFWNKKTKPPPKSATSRSPSRSSGPFPASDRPRLSFGQILVEEEILTPDALRGLMERLLAIPEDERPSLGRLLVTERVLDESTLLALLDRHGARLCLGDLLVMRQVVPPSALSLALREKAPDEPLGETLLRLRLVDPNDLAEALAEQSGITSIPIHRIPVQPALAKIVNPAYAMRAGIVPVAQRGEVLIVALSEPQNLPAIADLERATGLFIFPVLTTRAEIENRIRATYLDAELDDLPEKAA